jgi:antiviral helicase SKI2
MKEYLEANYLNPELHLPTAADAGRVWDLDWFAMARPPLEPSAPCSRLPGSRLSGATGRRRSPRRSRKCGILSPCRWRWAVGEVFGSGIGGLAPWMPGPAKVFVMGSINNKVFRPGGLLDDDAEAVALEKAFPEGARNGDWVHELLRDSARHWSWAS